MYGVNVLRDVERVEGNKMKEGYGFICVDLGIFTPSGSSSPTSAYIETYPPSGTISIENFVSPFFLLIFTILGPNPIEKSEQYTLNDLAAIK